MRTIIASYRAPPANHGRSVVPDEEFSVQWAIASSPTPYIMYLLDRAKTRDDWGTVAGRIHVTIGVVWGWCLLIEMMILARACSGKSSGAKLIGDSSALALGKILRTAFLNLF